MIYHEIINRKCVLSKIVLPSLAEFYTKCINESSTPCISSAVERLREIEGTRALDKSISLFVNTMDVWLDTDNPTPVNNDQLENYCEQASSLAVSELQNMSFFDKDRLYENKLLVSNL